LKPSNLFAAGVLVACGAIAAARQDAPQRTLSARTGTIAVDFQAVTADGRPVTDLKPEDVILKVDNRARTLTSLQLIEPPMSAAANDPGALPAPFGTNAAGPVGRAFALVIDDETIRPGHERETTEIIS
jgi:hypothetical protein